MKKKDFYKSKIWTGNVDKSIELIHYLVSIGINCTYEMNKWRGEVRYILIGLGYVESVDYFDDWEDSKDYFNNILSHKTIKLSEIDIHIDTKNILYVLKNNNYKIWFDDNQISKDIQEKLFTIGYTWSHGKSLIFSPNGIFLRKNKYIFEGCYSIDYFHKSSNFIEISAYDFLNNDLNKILGSNSQSSINNSKTENNEVQRVNLDEQGRSTGTAVKCKQRESKIANSERYTGNAIKAFPIKRRIIESKICGSVQVLDSY